MMYILTMERTKPFLDEATREAIEAIRHSDRILELKTFSEIGKALTSSVSLNEVMEVALEQITKLLRAKYWSLLLIDEVAGELKFEIAVGEGADKLKEMRLKLGEGIAGWVAEKGVPLLVPDVRRDPRFTKKGDNVTNFQTRSIICVPLVTKGKTLGVIELINKVEEDFYGEQDLFLLTTMADYTAIAIENALLFDKIQQLTVTDDLTQLGNSRFLHTFLDQEVERAKRYDEHISMIFIDMDHFKQINDVHGHLCGSKMLTEFAGILKRVLRKVDIACRYGGDEFVIVLPATPKDKAKIVAEKILTACNEHVFLKEEGLNKKMTASIGVASFPVDAKSKLELIQLADHAMYRVKNRSRNAVEVA